MKRLLTLIGLSLSILFSQQAYSESVVKVGITENLLNKYNTFINERSVYDIDQYDGNGARRSVIEVVLLLQSLKAGGINSGVEWVILPNYPRIQRSLESGEIALSAASLWNYDLPDIKAYTSVSTAIVAEGEYQAGLFKLSSNNLEIMSAKDLEKLTAISVSSWVPDWTTLTSLPLKEVIDANNWAAMVRMLAADRGDFMLSSFKSSDDMGFSEGEDRFVPIEGVKMSLIGSRHFVVSNAYENSEKIFTALNSGIETLRNNGVINRAFTEAGFFNVRVKDWKDLRLE